MSQMFLLDMIVLEYFSNDLMKTNGHYLLYQLFCTSVIILEEISTMSESALLRFATITKPEIKTRQIIINSNISSP